MAELLNQDAFQKMIKSQDRLREMADRTTVALYRLDQYVSRVADAMSKLQASRFAEDSKKSVPAVQIVNVVQSVMEVKQSITAANQPEKTKVDVFFDWLDKGTKVIAALAAVSVINDFLELKKKYKERGGKGSDSVQKVVCNCTCTCTCKCSQGTKIPAPGSTTETVGGSKNRQGNKRFPNTKVPLGNNREIGTIMERTRESKLQTRTSPKVPPAPSLHTGTKPIDETQQRLSQESYQKNTVTDKNLGEKTKPVVPPTNSASELQGGSGGEEKAGKFITGKRNDSPVPPKPPEPPSYPTTSEKSGHFTSHKGKKGLGFMADSGGKDLLNLVGPSQLGKLKGIGKVNPLLNAATSVVGIATAENKSAAAVQAVAGAGGAALGSLLGSVLLPGIGTVAGGMVGGWLGDKAGQFLSNKWFSGKEKQDKETRVKPTNELSPTVGLPQVPKGSALSVTNSAFAESVGSRGFYPQTSFQKTPNELPAANPTANSQQNNNSREYNINIDGVQIVMPKEEIDEESLARRIGMEIVSKMRASLDNRVVTP